MDIKGDQQVSSILGTGVSINEMLAEKFLKPVIKELKTRKLYLRFKDNIWAADLTEMVSLSFKNRGIF